LLATTCARLAALPPELLADLLEGLRLDRPEDLLLDLREPLLREAIQGASRL